MRFLPFGPKYAVGLAYTAEEAAFVCLRRVGRRITLLHRMTARSLEVLQDDVRSWVASTRRHDCPAAIAIPYTQSFRKVVTLSQALTAEECEIELQENLSHYLPGIDELLSFDFRLIDEQDHSKVFLVAVRQSLLNQCISKIETMGLQMCIVDLDIHAKARFAHSLAGQHATIAFIERVGSEMHFLISEKNHPVFVQVCSMQEEVILHFKKYFKREKVEECVVYLAENMISHQTYLEQQLQQKIKTITSFHSHPTTAAQLTACGLALRVLFL
ncbi:MAG: pilus assembly protein PilM [Gammaproteobacteria bacterium]|nr:pilus assembly protein PilM [Gammaproteobacteria bacterium]